MEFTKTEGKMLQILSDGLAHTREEIFSCLPDDLGRLSNIRKHFTNIRKKIRPIGQDIICELKDRRICYRHVRLINRSE